MKRDTEEYIQNCDKCFEHKPKLLQDLASQDLPLGVIIDTPDFTRGGGNNGLASFYAGVTIVRGKMGCHMETGGMIN